jgi:ABC-type amino acid transport substrate-binding protein
MRQRNWMALSVIAALTVAPAAFGQAAKKKTTSASTPSAGALDRIQKTGTLKLGYRADARPFSFNGEQGAPAGYSVELCQAIAEAVKSELKLPALKVEWVPVTVENRLTAVQQHQVDVQCGAVTTTLERRKQVDFSTPIFPGGVGVVVRSDAPKQLRNILSGKANDYAPTWRAVALNVLREQVFATVPGTMAEQFMKQRSDELHVQSHITPVASYDAGIQAVLDGQASAFFAERAILLDAAKRNPATRSLTVIDRQFTYEPLALPVPRGDDDFRLLVDRTLSRLYGSPGFADLYQRWFGKPDESATTFFRWNALPE